MKGEFALSLLRVRSEQLLEDFEQLEEEIHLHELPDTDDLLRLVHIKKEEIGHLHGVLLLTPSLMEEAERKEKENLFYLLKDEYHKLWIEWRHILSNRERARKRMVA